MELVQSGHEIPPEEISECSPLSKYYDLLNKNEWIIKCGKSVFKTDLKVYESGKKKGEEYGGETVTQLWIEAVRPRDKHVRITYHGVEKNGIKTWTAFNRTINKWVQGIPSDATVKAFIKGEE